MISKLITLAAVAVFGNVEGKRWGTDNTTNDTTDNSYTVPYGRWSPYTLQSGKFYYVGGTKQNTINVMFRVNRHKSKNYQFVFMPATGSSRCASRTRSFNEWKKLFAKYDIYPSVLASAGWVNALRNGFHRLLSDPKFNSDQKMTVDQVQSKIDEEFEKLLTEELNRWTFDAKSNKYVKTTRWGWSKTQDLEGVKQSMQKKFPAFAKFSQTSSNIWGARKFTELIEYLGRTKANQ